MTHNIHTKNLEDFQESAITNEMKENILSQKHRIQTPNNNMTKTMKDPFREKSYNLVI